MNFVHKNLVCFNKVCTFAVKDQEKDFKGILFSPIAMGVKSLKYLKLQFGKLFRALVQKMENAATAQNWLNLDM